MIPARFFFFLLFLCRLGEVGKGGGRKIPAFMGGERMYEVAGRGCFIFEIRVKVLFFSRGNVVGWDPFLVKMKLLETRFSHSLFFLLLLL